MFDSSTKVLIVDDMMTMRKLVKKACIELGFSDFLEAADGEIALKTLQENPGIQLVISDWNMPNMTGLEFLKKVRADGKFSALPFVLLTAESEQAQVVEAIQAGVSGYIVKPFNTEALREKLEEAHQKAA